MRVFISLAIAALLASCAPATSYRDTYFRSSGISEEQGVAAFGEPDEYTEWLFSLAVEADRGNWEKVAELTASDRKSEIGTYYHNLANAMHGRLADSLMHYYQPFERGLFLPMGEKESRFVMAQAGEVWWQLGELTMAEHHTILGMIFSPSQSGERYIRRLAEINLAKGDTRAAEKYIRLLDGPVGDYWRSRAPLAPKTDVLHSATDVRTPLLMLLEANPANLMAYEYLLCYDLLTKDIAAFVRDFVPGKKSSRLFEEAALIYMASSGNTGEEWIDHFSVNYDTYLEFTSFSEAFDRGETLDNLQKSFGDSYWFYYKFAQRNEK